MVQPNTFRAQTFSEAFIVCGGIETLLVLLQWEAKAGDYDIPDPSVNNDETVTSTGSKSNGGDHLENSNDNGVSLYNELSSYERQTRTSVNSIGSRTSVSESQLKKILGGINFSISADNARNNVYNVDKSDGIVVAVIALFGALVNSGHLKSGSHAPQDMTRNIHGLLEGGGIMFEDKVLLLRFALQKAFQAAPNRLMTGNAYIALLGASV